jgi:hypothetical protein
LLSNFSFREYDLHIRCGGGNSKHDRRNNKSLARVHDSGNQFGFKPRGANRELERAWSKIVKGKLPIVARQHILFLGLILKGESHVRANGDGSSPIDNGSTDASLRLPD